MESTEPIHRFLYWFEKEDFSLSRKFLELEGYKLTSTLLTPCQVLKSRGHDILFAPPEVWSRICVRQGSWYRESVKKGRYMLMSDHKLPNSLDKYLDAEMSVSDFLPERLPGQEKLQEIVDSEAYQSQRPREWEGIGWTDAILFKLLFL